MRLIRPDATISGSCPRLSTTAVSQNACRLRDLPIGGSNALPLPPRSWSSDACSGW